MNVYYMNGDCTNPKRYLNISVNGGAAQNRLFNVDPTCDWAQVIAATVTLSGFTAGTNNTVKLVADGVHVAPDLDWIEITGGTASNGGTATSGGGSYSGGSSGGSRR